MSEKSKQNCVVFDGGYNDPEKVKELEESLRARATKQIKPDDVLVKAEKELLYTGHSLVDNYRNIRWRDNAQTGDIYQPTLNFLSDSIKNLTEIKDMINELVLQDERSQEAYCKNQNEKEQKNKEKALKAAQALKTSGMEFKHLRIYGISIISSEGGLSVDDNDIPF